MVRAPGGSAAGRGAARAKRAGASRAAGAAQRWSLGVAWLDRNSSVCRQEETGREKRATPTQLVPPHQHSCADARRPRPRGRLWRCTRQRSGRRSRARCRTARTSSAASAGSTCWTPASSTAAGTRRRTKPYGPRSPLAPSPTARSGARGLALALPYPAPGARKMLPRSVRPRRAPAAPVRPGPARLRVGLAKLCAAGRAGGPKSRSWCAGAPTACARGAGRRCSAPARRAARRVARRARSAGRASPSRRPPQPARGRRRRRRGRRAAARARAAVRARRTRRAARRRCAGRRLPRPARARATLRLLLRPLRRPAPRRGPPGPTSARQGAAAAARPMQDMLLTLTLTLELAPYLRATPEAVRPAARKMRGPRRRPCRAWRAAAGAAGRALQPRGAAGVAPRASVQRLAALARPPQLAPARRPRLAGPGRTDAGQGGARTASRRAGGVKRACDARRCACVCGLGAMRCLSTSVTPLCQGGHST